MPLGSRTKGKQCAKAGVRPTLQLPPFLVPAPPRPQFLHLFLLLGIVVPTQLSCRELHTILVFRCRRRHQCAQDKPLYLPAEEAATTPAGTGLELAELNRIMPVGAREQVSRECGLLSVC